MDVKLIAKIKTKKTNGKFKIGTGYPVINGKLLTTRHVIFDEYQADTIEIEWKHTDEEEPYHKDTVNREKISYDSEIYDIAVIDCNTPKGTNEVFSVDCFPDALSDSSWHSWGYPRAAKDSENRERIKAPAKGTIFQSDSHNHELHLKVDGNANEAKLWKGMSGAPVFYQGSEQLIAILIRTPAKYETDKIDDQGNKIVEDTYKERLFSTHIRYLIENDEEFCKAIGFRKSDSDLNLAKRILSSDSEFLEDVSKKISNIIDNPALKDALKVELGVNSDDTLLLVNKLRVTDSEKLIVLLDTELSNVVDKLKYTKEYEKILQDDLRTLASLLSVFVIPDKWVRDAYDSILDGVVIEIYSNQEFIGGAACARAYQTHPAFDARKQSRQVDSKGKIEPITKQGSWVNDEAMINRLIAHISNQLFSDPDSHWKAEDRDKSSPIINDTEIKVLNDHLLKTKEQLYIELTESDGFDYINDPEILFKLWKALPALMICKLTTADKSKLLISNDAGLRMAYQRFLVKL